MSNKDKYLTDEQVEQEIGRLKESPAVLLARQEQRIKYKRRQYLYQLRWYGKRGKELQEEGVTFETLKELEAEIENDGSKRD